MPGIFSCTCPSSLFLVFFCVFPHGSDRRVVLMRFYGSEQPAELMVLEGEILIER